MSATVTRFGVGCPVGRAEDRLWLGPGGVAIPVLPRARRRAQIGSPAVCVRARHGCPCPAQFLSPLVRMGGFRSSFGVDGYGRPIESSYSTRALPSVAGPPLSLNLSRTVGPPRSITAANTRFTRRARCALANAGYESSRLGRALETPAPTFGRLSGLRESMNVSGNVPSRRARLNQAGLELTRCSHSNCANGEYEIVASMGTPSGGEASQGLHSPLGELGEEGAPCSSPPSQLPGSTHAGRRLTPFGGGKPVCAPVSRCREGGAAIAPLRSRKLPDSAIRSRAASSVPVLSCKCNKAGWRRLVSQYRPGGATVVSDHRRKMASFLA